MPIDSIPVWQVIIAIICGLGGLISILSQLFIANLVRRLNRHGDKIEDHQDRLTKLEGNYTNGLNNTQSAFDTIEESLEAIKGSLVEQNKEAREQAKDIRAVDLRLTDFIIEFHKNKKNID